MGVIGRGVAGLQVRWLAASSQHAGAGRPGPAAVLFVAADRGQKVCRHSELDGLSADGTGRCCPSGATRGWRRHLRLLKRA